MALNTLVVDDSSVMRSDHYKNPETVRPAFGRYLGGKKREEGLRIIQDNG